MEPRGALFFTAFALSYPHFLGKSPFFSLFSAFWPAALVGSDLHKDGILPYPLDTLPGYAKLVVPAKQSQPLTRPRYDDRADSALGQL